jgi:hypothetical protein
MPEGLLRDEEFGNSIPAILRPRQDEHRRQMQAIEQEARPLTQIPLHQ